MKNLTVEQKNIISTIENEFIALNNTNSNVSFSIINVNMLNGEYNRILNGRKELEIYNKGMRVVTNKTMDDYIAKINADFKNGKVPLEAVREAQGNYYNKGIKIQFHVSENEGYLPKYSGYDFTFNVRVVTDEDRTDFGMKINSKLRFTIYTQFRINFHSKICSVLNRENDIYDSFDECMKSKDFNNKINRLYNSMSETDVPKYLWK